MMVTEQELNTITMAMALISIPEMEQEMEEQGLVAEDVEFNHLTLFESLTKVTKLYPKPLILEEEVVLSETV